MEDAQKEKRNINDELKSTVEKQCASSEVSGELGSLGWPRPGLHRPRTWFRADLSCDKSPAQAMMSCANNPAEVFDK